jgi:hypothetical protein
MSAERASDILLAHPDDKRAALMAQRIVDGLKTIDRERRRKVFAEIATRFCTICGNEDPACPCGGAVRRR